MALADLEVVGVVRRCDLDAAGTELHVDVLVRDHRDLPVGQRELKHFPDNVLVPLIVRVHGHGGIAEQGLRAGRRDLDEAAGLAHDRIIDVPEEALLVHMLHLGVRDRGPADRAPVDDPGSLVDVALLIKTLKHLENRVGAALVHGEALAVPVSRGAELPKLLHDAAAVLLAPLPAVFQELFAADLSLVDAHLLQVLGYLDLRRDRGVVRARLPESLIALHSLPADQDVLHRVVECVAHVKLAGDVWRRHDDRERFLVRVHFRMEIPALHPLLVQPVLKSLRIVGLFEFLSHNVCFLPSKNQYLKWPPGIWRAANLKTYYRLFRA